MTSELQVLQDVDFGWVQSLDSVWSDDGPTDAGPNQEFADNVIAELATLIKSPNPPGRVFLGQAGIGKTHFVGVLRRRAWEKRCWFVMLDVVGITDFWKSAALSCVTSLLQEMPGGQRQYEAVIAGIARRFKIEKEVEKAFATPTIDSRQIVDLLVKALFKSEPANALKHQDVFRALALLRSHDLATVSIAHAWLQGYDADETMRRMLGFLTPPPTPVEIVRGLLWVMGLAGPTLIAVDQIDGVISSVEDGTKSDFDGGVNFTALLTGGLLDLASIVNRGMLVLTCLLGSWEIIKSHGPASLHQRFSAVPLRLMQEGSFVRRLVAGRLTPAFEKAGIRPPTPTWPFTDTAILSASAGMTPRTILMRCDEHRRRCLEQRKVVLCESLNTDPPAGGSNTARDHDDFHNRFVATLAEANITGLLDDRDDGEMGRLLRDTFDLYARQIEPRDNIDVESKGDPAQKTPPLHGRLTFTFHDEKDRQAHFCFRALEHANANAYSARLKAALTASGVAASIPGRDLLIVRRGPVPSGPKTRKLHDDFLKAGGKVIDPTDEDLKSFVALRTLRDQADAGRKLADFEAWLMEKQPLCETAFFKAAGLCPPPCVPVRASPPVPVAPDAPPRPPAPPPTTFDRRDEPEPLATTIPIGRRIAGDEPVELPISVLPRHTAIIAGAGSGKTVLLRRIVEEAALAGIPAIVIDPNNDLSRLGDRRPDRPEGFSEADVAKAARYHNSVEVVVWTPGIQAGNPLFLSVLPDFAAIGEDPDELNQAVTMAVDTLGPLAGAKTTLPRGVLSDALRHFARAGGGTLKDMTSLLADLPDGVSEIGNAEKLAAKMADELRAAVATNPLLKAGGPVLDPARLFSGRDAGRTRISVINLSGLASNEAREDFVNRLQMTLFGWIKKHPSPRGMLYVIDEAQIFIPSGSGALSKTSGVQLVAQARKYGLGMIVVTQAPKGIDNKVVSNCTTQFLGKQNAPATIDAARELIAAAGGRADDLGKLATGEFYFKTERSGKPLKVRTPNCLSWHPPNPPAPEEVITRARQSVGIA